MKCSCRSLELAEQENPNTVIKGVRTLVELFKKVIGILSNELGLPVPEPNLSSQLFVSPIPVRIRTSIYTKPPLLLRVSSLVFPYY